MAGKITAIMGASKTQFGTVRGQLHLRQTLHAMNTRTLSRPEVFVQNAGKLFNGNGNLVDNTTTARILKLLTTLLYELTHE
jgi:chromate reductase